MKKWTDEHCDWLIKRKDRKDLKELFQEFLKDFPSFNTTYNGFKNIRHELHITSRKGCGGRKDKKIGDEQIKKGMVRVKVGYPSVWVQKQKYVYERHYGIRIPKGWNVIFLDGDKRNFDINNLLPIPLTLVGLYLGHTGGTIQGRPDLSRLNFLIAQVIHLIFALAKKYDLTTSNGMLKFVCSQKAKERRIQRKTIMTAEEIELERKLRKEKFLARIEKLKSIPGAYEEWRKQRSINSMAYQRKKRGEQNDNNHESNSRETK